MLDRLYVLQEMVAEHQREMLAAGMRERSLRLAHNEPRPVAPIVEMGRHLRSNPGHDEQRAKAGRRLRSH